MPVTLPADLTSKTAAVNVLLSAIAESPVNSIEDSQSVDVAAALGVLNEVNLAVQSKGWHWNREEGMELAPNAEGEIELPANCLFISKAYSDFYGPFAAVERARKLYNRTDHTYTFVEPVSVDLVVRLEWEELPEYARRYITIRAAYQFQGRVQTSAGVSRILGSEVEDALVILEQREDEADEQSQMSGTNQAIQRLHGNVRRRNS